MRRGKGCAATRRASEQEVPPASRPTAPQPPLDDLPALRSWRERRAHLPASPQSRPQRRRGRGWCTRRCGPGGRGLRCRWWRRLQRSRWRQGCTGAQLKSKRGPQGSREMGGPQWLACGREEKDAPLPQGKATTWPGCSRSRLSMSGLASATAGRVRLYVCANCSQHVNPGREHWRGQVGQTCHLTGSASRWPVARAASCSAWWATRTLTANAVSFEDIITRQGTSAAAAGGSMGTCVQWTALRPLRVGRMARWAPSRLEWLARQKALASETVLWQGRPLSLVAGTFRMIAPAEPHAKASAAARTANARMECKLVVRGEEMLCGLLRATSAP